MNCLTCSISLSLNISKLLHLILKPTLDLAQTVPRLPKSLLSLIIPNKFGTIDRTRNKHTLRKEPRWVVRAVRGV